MMKKNICKKILAIFITLIIFCCNFTVVARANENKFYAQYSGSTTSDWGYKPNCTFTINKIVGNRFRGTFSATNLGRYNISQSVKGNVYKNYDSFTCTFSLENYYNTSFVF